MVATFVAVTIVGAIMIALEPGTAANALLPVLVLQLFAASSGFALPARRGHYDLILTIGERRAWIAAAHWVTSILPGVVSWIVLSAVELVTTLGSGTSIVSSGSLAALAVTSALPWALTVALPRFAAAIGWLLLLSVVAASVPATSLVGGAAGSGSWLERAGASLLYPPGLVGGSVVGSRGLEVLPALLAAAAAMACALVWIERHDYPLEAAQ
jgi:hypothetical protein